MIISRTPFRISFAGGGTDMPDFYKKYGGAVVSTTINKHIYICIRPNFHKNRLLLKYSKTEEVLNPQKLKNNISRAILSHLKITGLEITSFGDVPAQTGLGSSSSFAVGLYHALTTHLGKKKTAAELALYACDIEIDQLKSPIGKQDQYASAHGGLNFYQFLPNGEVIVEPIKMPLKKKKQLEENLILFYTGMTRSTNDILKVQKKNILKEKEVVNSLQKMTELAHETKRTLEKGNLEDFGKLLHKGWILKKTMASTITNKMINTYYDVGIKNGAIGGKLLGAGGGGCLLFYCEKEKQARLIKSMKALRHLPFSFTDKGSEIIFQTN